MLPDLWCFLCAPSRLPLAAVWIALNPTQVTKSFTGSVDFPPHSPPVNLLFKPPHLFHCLSSAWSSWAHAVFLSFFLFFFSFSEVLYISEQSSGNRLKGKQMHPESHCSTVITSVELLQGRRSVHVSVSHILCLTSRFSFQFPVRDSRKILSCEKQR